MDPVTQTFAERGDLAHLALFCWASASSGMLVWTMRELARSNRRFSEFVSALAKINHLFGQAT
jgi:cellobiose-specific phosphotransferase system component IIB